MTIYRCQVIIPMFTNIAEDVVTNTLYVRDLNSLGTAGVAALVVPRFQTFYNAIYGGTGGMGNYMVPSLARVNIYNMDQPEPRVPLTSPMVVTGGLASTVLPTEASVVLSFQGPREAGIPQARRRGRIYIGGLGDAWVTNSSSSTFPRPSTTRIGIVATAADALATGLVADNLTWVVWSPTDQAATSVTNGWVDNTVDTQRRRGVGATARTLWTL